MLLCEVNFLLKSLLIDSTATPCID